LLKKIAPIVIDERLRNNRWHREQSEDQIDDGERESADSAGWRPLDGEASEQLNCSGYVQENFRMRNFADGQNLSPDIHVAPDEYKNAEDDGSKSVDVATEISSGHLTVLMGTLAPVTDLSTL